MISQCRREKNNCYLSTWDVINGPESRKNCCLWSKVTTFTAMSLPTTFFTVRYSLYTLFLQIWKSYRNDIKQKKQSPHCVVWQDGTKNTKLPLKNTLKKRYVVAPVLILLHFNSKSWRISWGTCHFFWDTLQFKGNIEQKMSEKTNTEWVECRLVLPSVYQNVWYRHCDKG